MRTPVLPTFLPPPRRRSISGLSASAVLHVLLLFLILSPWLRRYHIFSADGSDLAGTGGGGGGARYISLPALRPPPAAARAVAVETPVVNAPVTVPTELPPPTPAPDSVPKPQPPSTAGGTGTATGPGQRGGAGGGQGTGTGGGAGPGTGGGERGTPPTPRQMLFPPLDGTPKALRGKSVIVRFFVNVDGRVDRVETIPVIQDGKFGRELESLMKSFRFHPARDSLGAIVAGIAVGEVTLSNH
ncbi:MAG: hypothetical protein ABJB33_02375 [Gemmatimonadota bacterium]